MRVIGVMGGTFDPIHFGHLRMAQELATAVQADEVRFLPAASPPQKHASISAHHRYAMVKIAIADNPAFHVDDRELARTGPSYTIDTLISLREELGQQTALCWFMGSDAFLGLHTWHRWQSILDYCHIVVAHRPHSAPVPENMTGQLREVYQQSVVSHTNTLDDSPNGHILLQHITALDISATEIRRDLDRNITPRYLMPQQVLDYINAHQLYRLATL